MVGDKAKAKREEQKVIGDRRKKKSAREKRSRIHTVVFVIILVNM